MLTLVGNENTKKWGMGQHIFLDTMLLCNMNATKHTVLGKPSMAKRQEEQLQGTSGLRWGSSALTLRTVASICKYVTLGIHELSDSNTTQNWPTHEANLLGFMQMVNNLKYLSRNQGLSS